MESTVSKDERTIAMLCHLAGLLSFIGPLVIWLLKKDSSEYIDYHGREALNFQISVFAYFIVCILLTIVVIGAFLAPMLGIASLVFMIIAAIKANDGERYRYPLIFRIL